MVRRGWASADQPDEEQPLLQKVTDIPVDSDVKNAARQLNKLMAAVVCCTVLAVIAWGHSEYLKSQDPVNRITELRRRIASAEHELAHGSVEHDCRNGVCAKNFLPPMARGGEGAGTNLVWEAETFVLPAAWNVLLDPEQSYWFWVIGFLSFCGVLLVTGALLEATSRKTANETWFQAEARKIFQWVRAADTFKQLCFYDPYSDPDQEPGEGNAYRLLAVVGPDLLGIKRKWCKEEAEDMKEKEEMIVRKSKDEFKYPIDGLSNGKCCEVEETDDEAEADDKGKDKPKMTVRYDRKQVGVRQWKVNRFVKKDMSKNGFEFTLPSVAGYGSILVVSFCLLTMQVYFPFQLITELLGTGSHFKLVGLKKVFYYSHYPQRVWLQLVPLLLMSCKFFVVVERTLRQEFNMCLWLYYKTYEGAFKYQVFGKWWSYLWITISLVVNFYIGIVMTLYVVVNIGVYDSAGGNLMDFILGIFGSFGLINFDDAIMESLPMWANWYKMHCLAAGHPQGEHPDGESVDEFFGPESVKDSGMGHDMLRWGEESQAEGEKGAIENLAEKPLKTRFVNVGVQLTASRPYLGFYYSGCEITKVAADGAAAWAVDMDEVKNGVFRHIDLLVPMRADDHEHGKTGDESAFGFGINFYPGTLQVKDVAGTAFSNGVRPKYKLVALNGENLIMKWKAKVDPEPLTTKDFDEIKDYVKGELKNGGVLRFHEKAQIFPAFGEKQGVEGSSQWQPIGDGDRGPYLYKGKDSTENGYWDYKSEVHKQQDEADGEMLPRLAWPPSTESLHMFWFRANEKWKNGCADPVDITRTKKESFKATFGVAIDRDSNGLLQLVATTQDTGRKQGEPELSSAMGVYAGELQHHMRGKWRTLWEADQEEKTASSTHHNLMAQFSQIPKGDECRMMFKPMKVLQKPKHTGLERGMVIHKINGETVQSGEDISRVLRKLKGDCLKYPSCEFDSKRFGEVTGQTWTGGTLIARDKQSKFIVDDGEPFVREFTMTLSRATDDTRTFDDVVHGIIYAVVRIMLFASLVFILATYYVDTTTGRHVGI